MWPAELADVLDHGYIVLAAVRPESRRREALQRSTGSSMAAPVQRASCLATALSGAFGSTSAAPLYHERLTPIMPPALFRERVGAGVKSMQVRDEASVNLSLDLGPNRNPDPHVDLTPTPDQNPSPSHNLHG